MDGLTDMTFNRDARTHLDMANNASSCAIFLILLFDVRLLRQFGLQNNPNYKMRSPDKRGTPLYSPNHQADSVHILAGDA